MREKRALRKSPPMYDETDDFDVVNYDDKGDDCDGDDDFDVVNDDDHDDDDSDEMMDSEQT